MSVRRALSGGGGGSRIALLFCLLVALAWQSCVIQTHIHPVLGRQALSSLASVQTAPRGGRTLPDRPATCPICQEAAFSGQYVAAGPAWLVSPAIAIAWYHSAMSRPSRRDLRSHAWNSRAPPARFTLPTA